MYMYMYDVQTLSLARTKRMTKMTIVTAGQKIQWLDETFIQTNNL